MLINDKLLTFDYYKDKMTLFLKNSYGVKEQLEILYQILVQFDNEAYKMFSMMNMLDENTITVINNLDENESDILDKIGKLFGLSRNLTVVIEDVTYSLNLTNSEFFKLIQTTIIKNSFSGTREEAEKLYKMINIPILMLNDTTPAQVLMIYDDTEDENSNLQKLFLSGLFTLKSMGISYTYKVQKVSQIGTFDVSYYDNSRWN